MYLIKDFKKNSYNKTHKVNISTSIRRIFFVITLDEHEHKSHCLCLSCLVSFRVSSFLRPLDLAPLNVAEVVAHEVALLYLLSDMGTGHLVCWGQPPGNASQPWSCLLKYEIRIV